MDKISGKAAGGESANTLDDKLQKADEDQVSNCENNNIKEEKSNNFYLLKLFVNLKINMNDSKDFIIFK